VVFAVKTKSASLPLRARLPYATVLQEAGAAKSKKLLPLSLSNMVWLPPA
jgi:hypothetical protein